MPVNPDKGVAGFGDEGGNTLTLILPGHTSDKLVLHGYWDNNAVQTALQLMQSQFKSAHPHHNGPAQPAELIQGLADKEPPNWQVSAPVKEWPIAWANEILPFAREAHQRLTFEKIDIVDNHGTQEATGIAEENTLGGGISYEKWSGRLVENEIHRAGWRLAALLDQIVH